MSNDPEKLKAFARQKVRPWDETVVDRALSVAFRAHRGQRRATGEPFVTHPIAVARMLSALHCDLDTFIAALLHDVVEDTVITLSEITDAFGANVALIVDSVTKLSEYEREQRQLSAESQRSETVRKILVGAAKDVRVAYIKLADRAHNLATTDPRSSRVERVVNESLTYFAPLARELGIGQLDRRLRLWCLSLARPAIYGTVQTVLKDAEREIGQRLRRIRDAVESKLKSAGVSRDTIDVSIEDAILTISERVTSDSLPMGSIRELAESYYYLSWVFDRHLDCYTALGHVHTLWTPVYTQFQDWIATPMPSGYAAIHTLVKTDLDELVTFRLQTREMRQRSEWGPLFVLREAHDYRTVYESLPQIVLLDKIRQADAVATDTERFLQFVRVDVLSPKIRVFMKGTSPCHIPHGSSVVDALCASYPARVRPSSRALVNKTEVGLHHRLHDGDFVEMLPESQHVGETCWEYGRTHLTIAAEQILAANCQRLP
jgi:GTP pyrophosphokinase